MITIEVDANVERIKAESKKINSACAAMKATSAGGAPAVLGKAVAWNASVLKLTTADSASLKPSEKCKVPAGVKI